MKRLLLPLLLAALVLVLPGCATLMRDSTSQQITPPRADRVKIVFMRTSFVAGAVGCDLFEMVDGELRFIGQLPMGTKLVYETTPGDKVFMAYGLAADFMIAKLAAGRTYYSIVRPNWGTSGFYPTPVRLSATGEPDQNSKEFKDWLSSTKLIEPTEAAGPWFQENKTKMRDVYGEYWGRFQRKTAAEKAERTMNPGDGR
jgi:hypothetical protein